MNTPLDNAKWITPDIKTPSPIIMREFSATEGDTATLYITGLGYFEAFLNGKKLGCDLLSPNPTDYEKREFTNIVYPCKDTFTHRIYYKTFELKELKAVNNLEIHLGGGWYVQEERIAEGEMSYSDRVKCIYSVKFPDGEINSDGSESWKSSEIVFSNIFIGEIIDPTAQVQEGKVALLDNPKSLLCPEIGPADREIRTIKPQKIGNVYDAGENVSGYVRIKTKAGYKGKITLRFSEEIKDGNLDFGSIGHGAVTSSGKQQIMTDIFVCDGSERVFEPKFIWHCFRYFDVEGEFQSAEVVVVHSDVAVTSGFESDNEGCNFLYDAFIRTELDNMHGSFPSDCPHRERLGYTGDGQITAQTVMLLMDSREFYRKWIRDILDCQDIKGGHIQHTAPFNGGGGGPGGWGSAVIIVPYWYWKVYGERETLKESYPAMKKWIGYLVNHSENNLVVREEDGGWCLGDWETLEKCTIPEPLVNSYYLVVTLRMMREIAEELGEAEEFESSGYSQLETDTLKAIKDTYFTGDFDRTQGRLVYGADLGLVSMEECAKYYENLGHFDTGIFGTDILCQLLFDNGYADVFGKLLAGEEAGTFLNMKRQGATTLWEHWHGGSHCHPMFGGAARQLFTGILGIKSTSPNFETYEIKPNLPKNMNYAKGFITTAKGKISVELKRKGDNVEVKTNLT